MRERERQRSRQPETEYTREIDCEGGGGGIENTKNSDGAEMDGDRVCLIIEKV